MGLRENRRAVSAEVLKIALAMLLALSIFALLVGFAFGPTSAEDEASQIGANMLRNSENASLEIIAYNWT